MTVLSKWLVFTFSTLFSISFSVKAIDFSGKIINKEGQPVEFVGIVILNMPDSTFIAGTVSDESGYFNLKTDFTGQKILQISCLGFLTKWVTPETIADSVDTCEIILERDEKLLKEVTVKASSSFYRKNNSLIINVASSLLSSAGTSIDVIKQIPGIIIRNDIITVFSKGEPVIYLDGRKLYDKAELKTLKSSEIATIELISNPGVKYDAEGRSVLLIKMKRMAGNGWSALVSETLSRGCYFNDQEDVGLSYTGKNIHLFSSYNHLYSKQDRNPMASHSVFADTLWKQDMDIQQTYTDRGNRLTFGGYWSPADNHTLGGQYQGTFSSDLVNGFGAETVLADRKLFDIITSALHSNDKRTSHLLNAYYEARYSESFKARGDFDYYSKHNSMNQSVNESSSMESRLVTVQNWSDYNLFAGRMTLNYTLGEYGNFEFGGEYNHIYGNGSLINQEQYIKNNVYENFERKIAGFINYANTFNKYQFEIGLRYEFTQSENTDDSLFFSIQDNRGSRIYPTVSLTRTVGKVETGLSFSKRIRRPAFAQLNSNNYYINRFLLQQGNPFLKNEDIYQLDVYAQRGIFDFGLGYIYRKNPIGRIFENSLEHSAQTVMTYVNFQQYQEINTLINCRLNYKILQSQISTGMQQPFFQVIYMDSKQQRNQPLFFLKFVNDIVFPKNYILSANFIYQSKSQEYATEIGEYKSIDLGIRKSFINNMLDINLQVTDVFNWIRDNTSIKTNNVSYIQHPISETRFLFITVNYRFNNYKKYREHNMAQEDIKRL